MKFELTEEEVKNLEAMKAAVKLVHDEVGDIEYTFSGGGGIGSHTIKVTFTKHNITKNITDYRSW